MPVIRRDISTLEQTANFIRDCLVPSLLKSVEYDDTAKLLTATDNHDHVVLKIKERVDQTAGYFRAYRSETNYFGFQINLFPNTSSSVMQAIGCENGCIFKGYITDGSGYGKPLALLIAETNNNEIAFIFPMPDSASASSMYYTSLHHIAFGDDTTFISTLSFSYETGRQTILNVFGTNPKLTESSITPKAFYISCDTGILVALKTFTLNGEEFITNGYWAISTKVDEPAE
ncbi:MAG: hypothetical protein J5614_00410 [Paludibacteraceae bacterium]|nr:hypothetical protein [Paludibacteraceae bacterium]